MSIDPRYPGPQPDDPSGWSWRYPLGGHKPCVTIRCAGCGRPLSGRTTCAFYNLHAPLGRGIVVGWHDRCEARDPLREDLWWNARQDTERWRRVIETVRTRGPGRVGPGDAYRRAA